MQKRKLLVLSCSLLFVLSLFVNIQYAAAKSRKELLGDFLVLNQTTAGGFKNSNSTSSDSITPFSSYVNIYLINELERLEEIDKEKAESYFFGEMENAIITENLTDFFYAYKGYEIVEGSLNETGKERYASAIKSQLSKRCLYFSGSHSTI